MSFSVRNLLLAGAGALVLLGLGYVSFRTDPVPVDIVDVTRGPLQVTINADGKTRVRVSKLGRIQALIRYRNSLAHGYNQSVSKAQADLDRFVHFDFNR